MTDLLNNERGVLRTMTGQWVDILDPDPATIRIEDIAYHLAGICRWGGACRPRYTVAEHCIRVSALVDNDIALEALLHDAAEYLIGDVSSPLKALLPAYRDIERMLLAAIGRALGVPGLAVPNPFIRNADMMMRAAEAEALMGEPSTGDCRNGKGR